MEPKYKRGVVIVKDYGGKFIRVSQHSTLRTKGIVCDDEPPIEKGSVNDEKLDNNISRAKAMIYEYAVCNPWDWFLTLTLDKAKYNRYDLRLFHKALTKWISNYNKQHNLKIKFLLIPEQHKDGAWHIHGFLFGLPIEHLRLFTLQEHLPKYIRDKLKEGKSIYNWESYAAKFGFCDIEPIRNEEAVRKYVIKYITKDMSRCVTEINAHMYYCSRGLKRAEELKKGKLIDCDFTDIAPIDYENDYVRVAWLPHNEDILQRLTQAVRTDRELKQEGQQNHDIASSTGGIPDRPTGERQHAPDPALVQTIPGVLPHLCGPCPADGNNPPPMQTVLYPPDG